jgi:hypothetical protein
VVTGEVATALVGLALAGFGFAGYSYRRYDTLPSDSKNWLSDYFRLQASRQAAALEDVLRFTLPELFESYFETTPDEDPIPVSEQELRSLAADIAANPADAAYLERRRLTDPLTRSVLASLREQLDKLAPGVIGTQAVQGGLMHLRVVTVDSITVQHRIRSLAKAFLLQAGLGAAFGFFVLGYVVDIPATGLIAAVLFALCLLSTVGLEIARDQVRESLRLEKSAAELAQE